MSEREINERRNWKAQVFPYDYFIPDDSSECQYCLTDKQAEILRGIIEPLAWHTRWWSDSDTPIDQDAIQAFRDDLTRRLMMSCCGDEIPVQYRYTDDGTLQRSDDGGTTWTDAPEFDPRNNSPQFPPMPGEDGEDKKCIAATGAVALIKEQVGDQLTDDMSRYTLGQLISDWVKTMIETSNPFQALVTVVVNQIFALVISALRPALTDDVYGKLKCILYCHMGDDASVNQTQWEDIRSQITSKIDGIAGVFLEHLFYLLGPVGTMNLIRAGAATSGTCDCDCIGGCQNTWKILNDDHANYGTIIARDSESITVQSSFSYEGRYDVHVHTGTDISVCCECLMIETVSGAQDSGQFWAHCNETDFQGGLSNPIGQCVHYFIWYSTTPFTLKITFADCP